MSDARLRLIPARAQLLSVEVPSFRLEASEALAEGLNRVTLDQLQYARRALKQLPIDVGVHEARKATRRVRALLLLVRRFIGDGVYQPDSQKLREVARKLGPARDAAVLRRTFDALAAQPGTGLGTGVFDDFRQHLATRERLLESEVDEAVRGGTLGFLDQNSRWVPSTVGSYANRPAIPDTFDAISPGIKQVYRRGRKRMDAALANPSIMAFHLWRNSVRYLRYQIDLISGSSTYLASEVAPSLAELAVGLGTEHDLAVLSELVSTRPDLIPNESNLRLLLSLLEQRRLDLQAALEPIGKRIYSEQPRDFVDSLRVAWGQWRLRAN